MLGNENLWQAAEHCHRVLAEANIPYAICGGVAVCLHGYQRNTVDADIIINAADSPRVKELLLSVGLKWSDDAKEFRTTSGVAIQFLIAGEPAGKGSPVVVPEPTGELNVEEKEGLRVVRLSRLMEMKIAWRLWQYAPHPQRFCRCGGAHCGARSRWFIRPLSSQECTKNLSRVAQERPRLT